MPLHPDLNTNFTYNVTLTVPLSVSPLRRARMLILESAIAAARAELDDAAGKYRDGSGRSDEDEVFWEVFRLGKLWDIDPVVELRSGHLLATHPARDNV